jgi:hypothetical protein
MAIARERPVNSNRGKVFSVSSKPKYYKQNKISDSELFGELVSYRTAEVQLL